MLYYVKPLLPDAVYYGAILLATILSVAREILLAGGDNSKSKYLPAVNLGLVICVIIFTIQIGHLLIFLISRMWVIFG